jgi:hypothetical protein
MHQMLAIVVFSVAIMHAERLSHRETFAVPQARPAEQGA